MDDLIASKLLERTQQQKKAAKSNYLRINTANESIEIINQQRKKASAYGIFPRLN